jgi:biotin carboxylase
MSKQKVIMILGGGIMQLPAIRIARARGWRVIVAGMQMYPEAAELADHVEYVDLRSVSRIVRVAQKYRQKYGLDGVFTAGTDFSITVARTAEEMGLPGIPFETAFAATNKTRMRAVFAEHGLPSPWFCEITSLKDCRKAAADISFPVVVKPVDNMGARGVRRVDIKEELATAVEEAMEHSAAAAVIVEEYLQGDELSLDAVVYNGKITICGVADRKICFAPYFVEMGHTIPTAINVQLVDQVVTLFKRGIRALGINLGAAKGDIKLTPEGPVIGEIAARLSGGYMSGWTYPYSSGVEVTGAALNIAVGLPPEGLRPLAGRTSAERAFISIPGVISSIEGVSAAERVQGIRNIFLRTAPGSKVIFPTNNMEKCGNIISCAAARSEAVELAEKASQSIFLRLAPDNRDTESFLFGEEGESAYSIIERENLSILKALPPVIEPQAEKLFGIAVISLPALEREKGKDWHELPLFEALQLALGLSGACLRKEAAPDKLNLGSLFWRVFQKGGVQGAVYLIDTINALKEKPEQLQKILRIKLSFQP